MQTASVTDVHALGLTAINAVSYVAGHAIWSITVPIVVTGVLRPAALP